MESTSIQTQTEQPEGHLHRGDDGGGRQQGRVKTAWAQTQTKKSKSRSQVTQTPVVTHREKETQTDDTNSEATEPGARDAAHTETKQDEREPGAKMADDSAAHLAKDKNAKSDSATQQGPEKESRPAEEGPAAESQPQKPEPKSYAKAVSGEGTGGTRSKMAAAEESTSQSAR